MTSALMERSFVTSSANLGLVPAGLESKQTMDSKSKGSGKMEALEGILRKNTTDRQNLVNAPMSTQQPNMRHEQIRSTLRYGNDDLYKRYNNHIGDYKLQNDQVTGVADEAERALQLSTLESKRELKKLEDSNQTLSMLASQRGLHAASERQVKRNKKTEYHKLGNSVLL
jgi:hypothetical protein